VKNRLVLALVLFVFSAALLLAGPADGGWTAINSAQGAPQALSLQSNGRTLTGTADGTPITEGRVENNTVWFNVVRGGVNYYYKGTVNGSLMQLSEANGSATRTIKFNHN
jgi:hypothetical protein